MPEIAVETTLRAGKDLLRQMAGIYHPGEHDGVELGIASQGHCGAFIFPVSGNSLGQIGATLHLSHLDGTARQLLLSLFRQIPSGRCAVRLLSHGGASLFWPIDIAPRGIRRITEALGFNRFAITVYDYLRRSRQDACGLALELCPPGLARLRCYQMLHTQRDVEAVRRALRDGLQLPSRTISELIQTISVFGIGRPIVLNLGVDAGGELSAKLEFAGAPLVAPIRELTLNPHEIRFWESAAKQADGLGAASFNYVGIRYAQNKARSFTAYLDAHQLLRDP